MKPKRSTVKEKMCILSVTSLFTIKKKKKKKTKQNRKLSENPLSLLIT